MIAEDFVTNPIFLAVLAWMVVSILIALSGGDLLSALASIFPGTFVFAAFVVGSGLVAEDFLGLLSIRQFMGSSPAMSFIEAVSWSMIFFALPIIVFIIPISLAVFAVTKMHVLVTGERETPLPPFGGVERRREVEIGESRKSMAHERFLNGWIFPVLKKSTIAIIATAIAYGVTYALGLRDGAAITIVGLTLVIAIAIS